MAQLFQSSPRRCPTSSGRFSPEQAYRPRVSPPSVEDHDACAIYASVRKDATPSREPVELALANLQKMLHRAGNVDGEGDGCGVLVDIPRRIWAEEVRAGGHNPALALDPAFAVAHVFVERSSDLEQARARRPRDPRPRRLPDPRRAPGRASTRRRSGPTAREEEPHFWQVAGLRRRTPSAATASLFDLMIELEAELGFHVASFSADDLRLQGDGRAEGARRLLPRPPRRALRDRSAASATTATRPTPGRRSCACSRSRCSATTARSTRSRSCARRRACSASRSATAAPTPRT